MDNIDLTRIAVEAALLGGKRILSVYQGADFQVEAKADDSPLTLADRRSHEAIVGLLTKETPDIPILSEEGADIPLTERRKWRRFWLVDPLDGTKEFIKRNGEFTVNIALIEGEAPVIGVVYIPVGDVLYKARSGSGAYKLESASTSAKDGVRLPSGADPGDDTVRVVSSRSHSSPETESFIGSLRDRYRNVETVIAGSALKICLVAEGAADVYPRFGPTMEWDTGAGHCVALEAGCSFRRSDNGPFVYNKEILRNPGFIVERPRG